MKNPKVGKAEILESVVHFLKTEKDMRGQKAAKPPAAACSRQQAYDEGKRSCLMRISTFISSKSRELLEPAQESAEQASLALSRPQLHSARVYAAQVHTPACDSTLSTQNWLQQQQQQQQMAAVPQPQLRLTVSRTRCDTPELFSALSSITEPVWRPWPQS